MNELNARKIKPTNLVFLRFYAGKSKSKHRDVEITNNRGEVVSVFRWYRGNQPTKRNKYITINCFKYKLNWLSDGI